MVDYDDLSSALKGEVLCDLASGFFGARKAIDVEVANFEKREADLHLSAQRALCTGSLLNTLLLEGEALTAFCNLLTVDSSFTPKLANIEPCLYIPLPFAFSKAKRFAKLVEEAYSHVQAAFSNYLYGMTYRHIEKKIPVRTVGYLRYMEWGNEINQRIAQVNQAHAPSDVLSMARSMEVEELAKENATGAGIHGINQSLDANLCIRPISLENKGIGPLPDLPVTDDAIKRIRQFAMQLYKEHPQRINDITSKLEQQNKQRSVELSLSK